jgi:hypothetical protein
LHRPGVTPDEQLGAVTYFERADPQRAEQIARGASIAEGRRTQLLSRIYISTLGGSASQSPYAQDLRKRLDQSTDVPLLAATGLGLARFQPPESPTGTLGRKYIGRALAFDPNSSAGRELAQISRLSSTRESYLEMTEAVGREVSQAQYQKAAALPAEQRARFLPNLAEKAYWAGALANDSNHDRAAARQDWDFARKYANDALAVEDDFRNDPDYANRVYQTDIVLAMLSLRADGNNKEARRRLLSAAPLKTSRDTWFPTTLKLLVLLLRYGSGDDRAAVIDFCETHGKFVHNPGIDLLQSAQRIRKGIMPTWYQFEVTQFPDKPPLGGALRPVQELFDLSRAALQLQS